jgi:hypothetical protein
MTTRGLDSDDGVLRTAVATGCVPGFTESGTRQKVREPPQLGKGEAWLSPVSYTMPRMKRRVSPGTHVEDWCYFGMVKNV